MTFPISGSAPSGSSSGSAAVLVRSGPPPTAEPVPKTPPPKPVVDTVELSNSDQAEILKLSGETMKEIAETLGVSDQTVATILSPPRINFPSVK
jgi:DNA-binding NarL/FixJ family response regulator